MAIHYGLVKNPFTEDPDDYVGRVQPIGVADIDDVIERMILLKGATAVRAEVLSFIEDFHTAILSLLEDGFFVNTGAAIYHLTVQGSFDGHDDTFDPQRHRLMARLRAGRLLKRHLRRKARLVKKRLPKAQPFPQRYSDVMSDTINETLTPGGIGKLVGSRLKFDPDDPEQGVFFLSAAGDETRAEHFVENHPRRLIFAVPQLAPGAYTLEVRARQRNSSTLRSTPLGHELTVPTP